MSRMHVLVVGGGSIGSRHLHNLLDLAHEYELSVSLVEPNQEIVDRITETCENLDVYKDLKEALRHKNYDMGVICSPNSLHVSQAVQLLEHGSHLFIEKPVAISSQEIESLYAASEKKPNCLIMVGCNLRFHPGVDAIKNTLESSRIGRPLHISANFAHYLPNWRPGADYRQSYSARADLGGGILLDAIHEPDYLTWIFGGVVEVSGKLLNLGDLEMDVEDSAVYSMMHESGTLSQVHVDFLRRDKFRGCVVEGTLGTIIWESKGKAPESILVQFFDSIREEWEVICNITKYNPNTQYVNEMRYFLNCINNNTKPMNSLDEAKHTLQILENVRHSSNNNSAFVWLK